MAPIAGGPGGARQAAHSRCPRSSRGARAGLSPTAIARKILHPSPSARPPPRVQTAVVPKIAPLQRTITEDLQGARDAAGGKFQKSELGRRMSERAQSTVKEQKLEPWEKEIIATLEGKPPAKK